MPHICRLFSCLFVQIQENGDDDSLYSVSARPEFLGVIDDRLFENLGVIGKFRGSELFYVKYLFICLPMRPYYRYLKNVLYRKIMVISIGLRSTAFNCYFFCFMGTMQLCCVACS